MQRLTDFTNTQIQFYCRRNTKKSSTFVLLFAAQASFKLGACFASVARFFKRAPNREVQTNARFTDSPIDLAFDVSTFLAARFASAFDGSLRRCALLGFCWFAWRCFIRRSTKKQARNSRRSQSINHAIDGCKSGARTESATLGYCSSQPQHIASSRRQKRAPVSSSAMRANLRRLLPATVKNSILVTNALCCNGSGGNLSLESRAIVLAFGRVARRAD